MLGENGQNRAVQLKQAITASNMGTMIFPLDKAKFECILDNRACQTAQLID